MKLIKSRPVQVLAGLFILMLFICGLGSTIEGMSNRRMVNANNNTVVVAKNNNVAVGQPIPKNQIPPGQDDLYILKSEIVPPVCPACPSSSVCPRQKPCPACPPCARCPEPSFECKKVPNYATIDSNKLPMPVLSDFSQFGM